MLQSTWYTNRSFHIASHLQIRDLHLDRPALQICARLERLHRLLQREPMRNQLPNPTQNTRVYEPNRLRPRIRIPILELQVHLPRRQPHERELHLVLAHPNNEHLPTETNRMNGGSDGRLDTGALQDEIGLETTESLDEVSPDFFLGFAAARDLVGDKRAWEIFDELLRESESSSVDICDQNRFCAGCLRA